MSYVDYKLKKGVKWSERGRPEWMDECIEKSKKIK